METFALYLIKSTVWLTGFFLIYIAFLRNERFFVLNRIYLVSGILLSILFPLFTWHYTVIFPVTPTAEVLEPQIVGAATVSETFQIQNLLLYFYLIGVLCLLFRLIKQTVSVRKVIRNSETHHFNSIKLIRTDRYPASFSFFSFVFVNPSIDEPETSEIVNHEQEHIRQRHWIDLLLFEILCTIQWFNPIVWIYGRFIRQNHEFMADEYAIQRSSNPAIYRAALLNQMFGVPVISLANSFNYSINKKRFNMMKQITYSPFRKLKLLLVLPLIAGVFYAFATPEYKFVETKSLTIPEANAQPTWRIIKGTVIQENGEPLKGEKGKNGVVIITSKKNSKNNNSEIVAVGYAKNQTGEKPKSGVAIRSLGTDKTPLMVIDWVISDKKIEDIDPNTIQSMSVWKDEKAIEKYGGKGNDGVIEITTKSALQKNKPLYVLDGKILDQAPSLDDLFPDNIESVSVLKDESATILYGDKGKNGVVLIVTKKDKAGTGNNSEEVQVIGYGKMQKDNSPEQSNSGFRIRSTGTGPDPKPLIVIDGVIAENQNVNDIPYETIESINVLKGESATSIYGEKGKNGVILITIKKEVSTSQNGTSDVVVVGYGKMQNQNSAEHSSSEFRIRSAETGNKPLIVKDGVISENLKIESIDPETILLINVLKNESAAAKYGEKGKNGVLEITTKKTGDVFTMVEEMPQFPGGTEALKTFVYSTLKYPTIALENGIQGQVFVKFVVDKTGKVTNAKVSRGVDPSLDKEAKRIVESMPKWSPGKQQGENVDVTYEMPINFNMPADYHPKNKEKLKEKK